MFKIYHIGYKNEIGHIFAIKGDFVMEILDEKISDVSGKTIRLYIPPNPNGESDVMVISHRDASKSHSIVIDKDGVLAMLKCLNKAKTFIK